MVASHFSYVAEEVDFTGILSTKNSFILLLPFLPLISSIALEGLSWAEIGVMGKRFASICEEGVGT